MKNTEINWNSSCRSMKASNTESNKNCSPKNSTTTQSQQPKPRLTELCGYKLYNDPDPNYPEFEEEVSFQIDVDPVEEVGREREMNKVGKVPSYELVAQVS